MLRLARHTDVPVLVQMMLKLRHTTAWSMYTREGYNHDSLTEFVTARLLDIQSVCYVWDADEGVTGFCGGSLSRFYLPPHMPIMHEWGWYGEPKVAVQCWKMVQQWAKQHGAELSYRVSGKPGNSVTKFVEQGTWEVL